MPPVPGMSRLVETPGKTLEISLAWEHCGIHLEELEEVWGGKSGLLCLDSSPHDPVRDEQKKMDENKKQICIVFTMLLFALM